MIIKLYFIITFTHYIIVYGVVLSVLTGLLSSSSSRYFPWVNSKHVYILITTFYSGKIVPVALHDFITGTKQYSYRGRFSTVVAEKNVKKFLPSHVHHFTLLPDITRSESFFLSVTYLFSFPISR